ncbi:hypothetical protein CGLO_17209 [Colletotrichum gloeosporioides Cg-14]|uniref:Uncharacterized protein n=1 Tax=Colletotrichum gloeosporioides (strain Cg-14) TaxID=1237896 RepID=T0JLK9_COLGC|nr:hypothetical protein CGLO_17209 [Colletotrichum gloeosporioides Cg-14]
MEGAAAVIAASKTRFHRCRHEFF